MKKLSCLLFLLLLLTTAVTEAHRNSLVDNPNYIFMWKEDKVSTYLQKSSLVVQKYDPPKYNIKITVITADRKNRITDTQTVTFYYSYDRRRMYRYVDGKWEYLSSTNKDVEASKWRDIGEITFCLANNRHFYGKDGGYSDEFYERIPRTKNKR